MHRMDSEAVRWGNVMGGAFVLLAQVVAKGACMLLGLGVWGKFTRLRNVVLEIVPGSSV